MNIIIHLDKTVIQPITCNAALHVVLFFIDIIMIHRIIKHKGVSLYIQNKSRAFPVITVTMTGNKHMAWLNKLCIIFKGIKSFAFQCRQFWFQNRDYFSMDKLHNTSMFISFIQHKPLVCVLYKYMVQYNHSTDTNRCHICISQCSRLLI